MRNTSVFVCLSLTAMTASAAEPSLYKPHGQKAFDFWYAKSGETDPYVLPQTIAVRTSPINCGFERPATGTPSRTTRTSKGWN